MTCISYPENIPAIIEAIIKVKPKRMLDIGAGFGKWSLLAKEALLSDKAEQGDWLPADELRVDGYEMAKYFVHTPWIPFLYERWHNEDVFEAKDEFLMSYDLIILIDVLEHWEKDRAKEFLARLKALNSGGKILVSTPKQVYMYTEHYYGEDCPRHISQWETEDFTGESFSTPQSHIYLF